MLSRPANILRATLFVLSLPLAAQTETVLLDDTFNDNNRDNQNLPASARWFGGGNANLSLVKVADADHALQNTPGGAIIRHLVAYFAPPAAPVRLASGGDQLTVSFDLTASLTSQPANDTLRVALLHSGPDRLASDTNARVSAQGGYGFFINPGTQDAVVRLRTADAGVLLSSLSAGNGWTASPARLYAPAASQFAFRTDTTYRLTLVIERTTTGLKFTYTASGPTDRVTSFDTLAEPASFAFDTLAIGWGDAFGPGRIDNVRVTVSSR